MKKYFLLVIFPFMALAHQPPEIGCARELGDLFASVYDSPSIYVPNYCFVNAGELAIRIQEALGKKIDPSKLRIMIIKHRENIVTFIAPSRLPSRFFIVGKNPRNPQFNGPDKFTVWVNHVVVEYEGRIIDLDLPGRHRILSAQEYFGEMFPRVTLVIEDRQSPDPEEISGQPMEMNNPDELAVIFVSTDLYRRNFPQRQSGFRGNQINFIHRLPVIPLPEYLRTLTARE